MPALYLLASGSNATNQLALRDTPETDAHNFTPASFDATPPLPPGHLPAGTTRVVDVRAGAGHTIVLLERCGETEVWGAGDGARGQLGPVGADGQSAGVFRPLDLVPWLGTGRKPTHIAAAWATSYVVLSPSPSSSNEGDVVLAFGADDFALLGGTSSPNSHSPAGSVGVVSLAHLNLPPLRVTSMAAGPHHVVLAARTLPLSSPAGPSSQTGGKGLLIGWGAARHGQLGAPSAPFSAPRILDFPTPGPGRSLGVGVGSQHTAILLDPAVHLASDDNNATPAPGHSSRLIGAGSNRAHQLDLDLDLPRDLQREEWDDEELVGVGCTWRATYAHTRTGVWSTGAGAPSREEGGKGEENEKGKANKWMRFPGRMLEAVACGSEHVLVLVRVLKSGEHNGDGDGRIGETEVWAWGWNEHGTLGVGHTRDLPAEAPVRVWPPSSTVPDLMPAEGPRTEDGNERKTEWNGGGRAVGVWAGCGTSWVVVEQ
ncbi:RCC1/BLIP-II protein [Athelia psychrophila]|uniref:RCC1/BLIP-II protein n=1 Tax=Athelia psychrophila TaxID=1759441 RepID=A0A165Z0G4_9AGAM|nr:RCC1/BLIP-II protein [Fibularhizoctonia sp. CBS 109695]